MWRSLASMNIEEIVDRESLEAWLLEQPREVSVRIAHRVTMRVLPTFWQWVSLQSKRDLTALPVLRSNLISGVACIVPTPEIRNATAAATAAAFASITATMWREVQQDCHDLVANNPPAVWPLWQEGDHPDADLWAGLKGSLGEDWAFWRDWYQDALDGVAPDWEMLEEIALIDPDIWEQGPEVVNALIAEIVEKHKTGGDVLRGRSAHQVLAENTRVIRLQFETMVALIEDEILRVHGANEITKQEAERIGVRVAVLQDIIENLQDMLAALEGGAGRALVVIEEQLPQVVEAAQGLNEGGEAPQVSNALVAMAASVKCLTDAGVPGALATGMAGADIARVAVLNKFRWSKPKAE